MPYLFKAIFNRDIQPMKREFNIIIGAENADLAEVRGAIQENQSSVNEQDPDTGLTAMHIAAADSNASIFNELMNQPNLDLEVRDYWGRTAIDLAISAGHEELTERLFERRYPQFFGDDDPYPNQGPHLRVL